MNRKLLCALTLLWFCGAALADQKTEADLRARLAASEAARVQATKDKAALTAALAKLADATAANAGVSRQIGGKAATAANQSKAQDAADVNAADARNIAEANGDIAREAAARALEAAAAARAQAEELQRANERSNDALLITQVFGFMAILLGFIYKGWTEARDHRWTREDNERRDASTATHQNNVEQNLKTIKQTGDDTHTLVNNNMAIQLRLHATTARALADETGKPEHLKLALEAERALEDHLAKQVAVDQAIVDREKADGEVPDGAQRPPK